jgi:histidinol-phosphate/aromatic aminotransferase/cobyric acid decarboxylase-like protein
MDESFLDFLDPAATLAALGLPNVWAVRSLTKFWALPGLRIGLAFAPDVREAFALRRNLPDWPVNTLAQLVGARALAETDEGTLIQRMRDLRAGLESELGRCGNFVKVLPGGKANFLLTELTDPRWDAFRAEAELLSKYGLAVRNCANFLFPGSAGRRYLRIAVKSGAENSLLVDALAELSHVVP